MHRGWRAPRWSRAAPSNQNPARPAPTQARGAPAFKAGLVLDQEQEKKQEHQDTTRPAPLPFPPVPSVPGGRKTNMPARSGLPQGPAPNAPRRTGEKQTCPRAPACRRAPSRTRRAERDHRITQPFILFLPAAHSAEPSKILPAPPAPEVHIGGTRHKS